MTTSWNIADIWEAIAGSQPDEPALITERNITSWLGFNDRATRVASSLLSAGCVHQDKCAQYLYNSSEYLESVFACFKAGLVPVNTNYRYTEEELFYLWNDADVQAVIFDEEFTEVCERLRSRLNVRIWLRVGSGDDGCPTWAIPYETIAASTTMEETPEWDRRSDDMLLIYTGGTTGKPKGVMWTQDSLFKFLAEASNNSVPVVPSASEYLKALSPKRTRAMPASPLMHGTALFFVLTTLSQGGSVFLLPQKRFSARALLDAVQDRKIQGLAIVGDAIGGAILDELEGPDSNWDLDSLRVVLSSGMLFSPDTKRRLLIHMPRALIVDGLGSTETGTLAKAITRHGEAEVSSSFVLGSNACLIDEDGQRIPLSSVGRVGRIGVAGPGPSGYYKDPVKTAGTFLDIDGTRFAVPGDWAEIQGDGSVRFLGRGSSVINSGGEKVFVEEVEEVLRQLPFVRDVAVIGVPSARFGEAVVGIIESREGSTWNDEEVINYARQHLAGYKVPKRIVRLDSLDRGANGKVNYQRLQGLATVASGSHGAADGQELATEAGPGDD